MSSGGNRRQLDQEFELNIASIVDCFTVLITYLLAAASFISLGNIEIESLVQRAQSTGSQLEATLTEMPPKVILDFKSNGLVSVSVWKDQMLEKKEFQVFSTPTSEGRDPASHAPSSDSFSKPSGEFMSYLDHLSEKYPQAKQAILVGDGSVPYGQLMKWLEPVKKKFSLFFGESS